MRRFRTKIDIKPCLATHFPSLSKGSDIDPDVHMFTEDIHLAIMPIGGRTDKQKDFAVEFQGDTQNCEKAKKVVSELCKFDRNDEAGIVCDAVENITRNLAWEGQAIYEIIGDQEQTYLNNLTTKNIFKVFNWYLQLIPPSDWSVWNRKISLVNKKKVWKVQLPHELGGVRGYKKILKKLRKYSHLGPEFYRQDLEYGTTSKDLDLLKYVRGSEIYFNSVTKAWGWNRRDWSQDKCTEFYTFHRMLNLKYAQALLREQIINEINRLLKRLKIKCILVVTGLPTSSDIFQMKCEMQKGELSFSAVTDKVAM